MGRGDSFARGRGPPRPPPSRPPGARPRRDYDGMRPPHDLPTGSMGFGHPGMMAMQVCVPTMNAQLCNSPSRRLVMRSMCSEA